MAYIQKTTDDEENPQAEQGPEKVLSTGAPSQDSDRADPVQTSPGKTSGTGWTNLVDYANANRGAGQQMAGKVTQSVQDQGRNAQQAGRTYQDTANKAVTAATPGRDQSIINDVTKNPTAVSGARADMFQGMRNAEYTGPKAAQDIAGYQETGAAYDATAKSADAVTDFEGRRDLLHNAYGKRSDYTAGEGRLDSFLTGANGGAQLAQTQQAYNKDSGFQKGWGDLVSSVSGNIGKADATAKATKTDSNAALDSAVSGINEKFAGYGKQAETTNAANGEAFKVLEGRLNSARPVMRAKAFAEIGLDAATGEWLKSQGYSMSQLIQAGKAMTTGDFASDGDIASAQSLYGLKGTELDPTLVAKSGGKGEYGKNSTAMGYADRARKVQEDVSGRLATSQGARDEAWGSLGNELTSFDGPSDATLKQLGLSRADYTFAYQQGIDPMAYAKQGVKQTAGDVASKKERRDWGNLMAALGLNAGTLDVADKQKEGDAYSIDRLGLRTAVEAKRNEAAIANRAKEAASSRAAQQKAVVQQAVPTVVDAGGDAVKDTLMENSVLDIVPQTNGLNGALNEITSWGKKDKRLW